MKISNQLSGAAGEYLVAAELMKRNILAVPTGYNTKNFDVFAANESGSKSVTIQVKTNQGKAKWFILSKKDESNFNENLFYVFVNLDINGSGLSEFFIVPSNIVAQSVKDRHQNWLNTPARNGAQHKDNDIREYYPEDSSRNNWELITNTLL